MDECKMRDVKVTRRALQRRISSFKKRKNHFLKYDCDHPIHLARELDMPHLALTHELK